MNLDFDYAGGNIWNIAPPRFFLALSGIKLRNVTKIGFNNLTYDETFCFYLKIRNQTLIESRNFLWVKTSNNWIAKPILGSLLSMDWRVVFPTLSKICDGAHLQEGWTAKSKNIFSQKRSIIDVWYRPKY